MFNHSTGKGFGILMEGTLGIKRHFNQALPTRKPFILGATPETKELPRQKHVHTPESSNLSPHTDP